jgi:purine-binding chemotaxis protein CheW
MQPHRQRHDPTKSLVGFFVGDVHYAVPIDRVREICNPMPIVAMPKAPPAVVGVADYRGHVVPVVDVRLRFGLPAIAMTRRTKWILVDVQERFIALVVDAVTEVFGTGGAELRAAPTLGGGEDTRGIAGVTNLGDAMVFVLEPARFAELTLPLLAAGGAAAAAAASLVAGHAGPHIQMSGSPGGHPQTPGKTQP